MDPRDNVVHGWVVYGPMEAVCRGCAADAEDLRARYPSWVTVVELSAHEADGVVCDGCGRPLRPGEPGDEPAAGDDARLAGWVAAEMGAWACRRCAPTHQAAVAVVGAGAPRAVVAGGELHQWAKPCRGCGGPLLSPARLPRPAGSPATG